LSAGVNSSPGYIVRTVVSSSSKCCRRQVGCLRLLRGFRQLQPGVVSYQERVFSDCVDEVSRRGSCQVFRGCCQLRRGCCLPGRECCQLLRGFRQQEREFCQLGRGCCQRGLRAFCMIELECCQLNSHGVVKRTKFLQATTRVLSAHR
jgi:hypothetical protein